MFILFTFNIFFFIILFLTLILRYHPRSYTKARWNGKMCAGNRKRETITISVLVLCGGIFRSYCRTGTPTV